MPTVLIATETGCQVWSETKENTLELAGRKVGPLQPEDGGTCLAVVDDHQVWRRSAKGKWSALATVEIALQSILSCRGAILCGGRDEATILRIPQNGLPERLEGFEAVSGRAEWFAVGPPLGVRSLAKSSDEHVLFAAVHVGGIPRSEDGGKNWTPTIPVLYDVHEVRAHPALPEIVVAAAAVGLCVSNDQGRTWNVLAGGLSDTDSFAVAMLDNEALFSIQDGPFAKRSQLWRWKIGGNAIEPVRSGLPEWLEGKVDTNQIAVGCGRFAVVDGGGNLWLSDAGSSGWKRIAVGLPYVLGVVVL